MQFSFLMFTQEELAQKRLHIENKLLENSLSITEVNFKSFSAKDIGFLFEQYDKLFFENYFATQFGKEKWSFAISRRMTHAGGKIFFYKQPLRFKIQVSSYLLFNSFKDSESTFSVTGHTCKNRLEALMRILEHEIIHLIEFIEFGNSSCKRRRFQTLAHAIFKHTEFTHQLQTAKQEAFEKYELKVGDWVSFTSEKKVFKGQIQRITKRATVMTLHKDGIYSDKQGNRYSKFYVPIQLLKKLDNPPI